MENEFEILGTVTEFIGNKGRMEFNSNNLANAKKRVMVTMINGKQTLKCLLSENLSADVRNKTVTMGNLITFSYGVNELGHHYIVKPAGQTIVVNAKDISAEALSAVDIDIEDFIAL